jgi:myo-inositol-1(or 4)-monophosphatase
MSLPLDKICKEVMELTHEAGKFIMQERDKFSQSDIQKKGFNDLVTYVDKNSEKILIAGLQKILPGSGILAEESGESQTPSASPQGGINKEYTWVIDPIDGTTNFIHRLPCFAISIGLHLNNYPIIGVVNELNQQECFSAIKGEGARLNGKPIQVSAQTKMEDALIATGFPYNDFKQQEAYMDLFKELMQCTQGIRRIGSASVDMCYVACGRFEVFYEYGLKPWDVSAGTIIVEEAGGRVSDFWNGDTHIFERSIIASNKKLHKDFSDVLGKYFPGE